MIECPICRSPSAYLATIAPYLDEVCDVFECPDCFTHFVDSDESMFEELHSNTSSYTEHHKQAAAILNFLQTGEIRSARKFLSQTAANEFIISSLEKIQPSTVLEIGCSKGYMTAYLNKAGIPTVGTDISQTAIQDAKLAFGDYFVHAVDMAASSQLFDAIFHVGVIGCVDDPVNFIKANLRQLKKGGFLIFNSPNVENLNSTGRSWVGTPPPDLTKLYHVRMWESLLSEFGDVQIRVHYASVRERGKDKINKKYKKTRQQNKIGFYAEKPGLISKVRDRFSELFVGIQMRSTPHEYGIFIILEKNR